MSEGLKSGYALWVELNGRTPMPPSAANRMEIIHQLLYPITIDENGDVIHLEPLITKEQALKLLELPDIKLPEE